MTEQKKAVHFSDGEKIICGVKAGDIATGDQVVSCKRCIALLQQAEAIRKEEPADPKAVHFSDGKKNICGTTGTGVKDEQKVTCKKCQDHLTIKAQSEGDPLVWCKVRNMDIPLDGVDFAFSLKKPTQEYDKSPMKTYHLLNNTEVRLPRSVIDHLKTLSYPYKRYVAGQEEGHAMQVAGRYDRFVIQEL